MEEVAVRCSLVLIILAYFIFKFFSKKKNPFGNDKKIVDNTTGNAPKKNIEKEKNDTESTEKPWHKKLRIWAKCKISEKWRRNGSNVTQMIVGLIGCHLLVSYFFPSWYSILRSSNVFWIDHFVIIFVVLFCTKRTTLLGLPKNEIRGDGVIILIILLIGNIARWSEWGDREEPKDVEAKKIVSTIPYMPQIPSTGCLQPRNTGLEQSVRKYMSEHLRSDQAKAMILIAERESQFNQYKSDGKTVYRRCPTPDNPSTEYFGIFQISKIWEKTAESLGSKYNFYTADGNMNFALWLFKKEGFKPWRESFGQYAQAKSSEPKIDSAPVENSKIQKIVAPLEKYSEEKNVAGIPFQLDYSGKVWVIADDKPPVEDGPGVNHRYGRVSRMKFKSREETAVFAYFQALNK